MPVFGLARRRRVWYNEGVAVLAQLVEQPPCKRQVVGAEPTHGSIFLCLDLMKDSSWGGVL